MKILGDSAFVVDGRVSGGKIVRVCKTNEKIGMLESEDMAAKNFIIQRVLPTERQSAKRVVRALKALLCAASLTISGQRKTEASFHSFYMSVE